MGKCSGQRLPKSAGHVLLLGDWNSKRRKDYTPWQWSKLFGPDESILTDYLTFAGLSESKDPLPFSVWGGQRCDYIYASSELAPRGHWDVVPIDWSDHYAVYLDLDFACARAVPMSPKSSHRL